MTLQLEPSQESSLPATSTSAVVSTEPNQNVLDRAQNSDLVLWSVITTLVVGILLRSFNTHIREWADGRRQAATARDDADIAELKRQVRNLTEWRALKDERDRKHAEWDREAYVALMQAGIEVEHPPPLF